MRSALTLGLMAIAALAMPGQDICSSPALYQPCDIVFTIPRPDVVLQAELKSPKFRTALVRAFPDGGSRWVLRFAPVDPGTYEYRLSGNVAEWQGKTGKVEVPASEAAGFIRPANVHHWIHPETIRPHLWMGDVNHQRVSIDLEAAWADGQPVLAYWQQIERQIRDANAAGRVADLSLARSPAVLSRMLPGWSDRERYLQSIVSRFASFDVTWWVFETWEDGANGRPLARELGLLLKKIDPYNHPRSTGSRATSAPLLNDGWMDFITIGQPGDAIPVVEHQFFGRPFVHTSAAPADPVAARKALWNATMSGQYPSFHGMPDKLLEIWEKVVGRTRYWELEPYFDVDGGRALALDEVEYLVYIEKPAGPLEVTTAKHGYDVYWIDPATGESTKAKDYRGEKFVSEPPSADHDWILHLSRDGRKEGMAKSYKFESRQNLMQEPEQTPARIPFAIELPDGDEISLSRPPAFRLKVTRETRATRQMQIVWTGEVVADGQGYRVLGTGPAGTMNLPRDMVQKLPAVFNLRLSVVNNNGKAYALDKVYRLVP